MTACLDRGRGVRLGPWCFERRQRSAPARAFLTFLFILVPLVAVFPASAASGTPPAPVDGYQVVHVFPHDPSAYTQGLVYIDGHLYESTGLNGRSSVRMVDLESGRVLQHYDVPKEYFGEGLTEWEGSLIQLTWQAETGFVYDSFSLGLRRTFHYKGEGWGLTHDAKALIMSDGTAVLRFLGPSTFREVRRVSVVDEGGRPVKDLNELEYVRGEIYANVWQTDRIVRISPRTGKVLGWIDLRGLMEKPSDPDAVLNGIAYEAKGDRLFVTGKLWPNLFEIRVVRRGSGSR